MLKSRKISLKTAAILTRIGFLYFSLCFNESVRNLNSERKPVCTCIRDIAWPYCYWSAHGSWPINIELAYTWNDVVEWNVKMGGATVQPTRNKHISRSAAEWSIESMPSRPSKPRQFAAARRISPRCFASVRRDMPRQAAVRDRTPSRCASWNKNLWKMIWVSKYILKEQL